MITSLSTLMHSLFPSLSRLTLAMGIFSLPFLVSGIDPSTSANILDRFNTEEREMIFRTIPASSGATESIFESEYRMNGIAGLRDKISAIQSGYQQTKDGLTSRRFSLEQMLATLASQIDESNTKIATLEGKIAQGHIDMARYNREVLTLRRTIYTNKTTILKYLAYIYSQGNTMYDEKNNLDTIKMMILNDGDLDQIISDITYKGLVTEVGQQYIEEYRRNMRDLTILNSKIAEQTRLLKDLHTQAEYEKKMLESKKAEREELLDLTKGQEALYEKYIASQEAMKETLSSEWQKARDSYSGAVAQVRSENGCDKPAKDKVALCQEIELYFQREREIRSLTLSGTNVLEWPVETRKITTYFHDPDYYTLLGSHHQAIDIGTPQGSPVRAAADGYVTYVLPPTGVGYAYLAIRHPSGFTTVYGHMSEISVEKYGFVRAGEIIGKSGGAPGTPWAGPMTTGAHLHFEVWQSQEPVDPLRFLTLKDIDPAMLASRYLQKFSDDVVAAVGESADLHLRDTFQIVGDTTVDRQRYLLSTYAAPSFQSWDMWVDAANAARLDPSFLMCVGLAETSLGYHLKTAYNVGNVGNTDRGDVVYFETPASGVMAMTKTFNNKYLGKYTRLSDLSRWGNTSGPIYASSTENWHNNIVKCVSALQGEFISDDYEFRLPWDPPVSVSTPVSAGGKSQKKKAK